MNTPDERLLVVLTCCARLTDAVEAEDQGLFKDLECAIDALNFKRYAMISCVMIHTARQLSVFVQAWRGLAWRGLAGEDRGKYRATIDERVCGCHVCSRFWFSSLGVA